MMIKHILLVQKALFLVNYFPTQDFSKKIGSHVSIHNTSFQGYSKKKHEFIFHTLICEPETDNSIIFEFGVDKTGHFRNIKDIEVSEGDDD